MGRSSAQKLQNDPKAVTGTLLPCDDRRTKICFLALIGILFGVSRAAYAKFLNVTFDASPLAYYVQYLDPLLLKEDLLRSLLNLHSQPPAFNLFLGLVLKAFPQLHDVVFHVVFLAGGLLMAWAVYLTMVAVGVRHAIAAGIAIIAMCEPTTVLYEHWLFYTYPVMVILVLALWFLRRATTGHEFRDYLGFFACFALVILTRSTYHGSLLLIMAAVLLVLQPNRRVIALAAAPAAAIVLAVHGNVYARFGALSLGDTYAGINAPVMVFSYVPLATHEELVRTGKVNGATLVIRRSGVASPIAAYKPHLPRLRNLPPTGIPALDAERKTNGRVNFNHRGFRLIADQVLRDSLYGVREYPAAYLRYLVDNIHRYGLSRELAFPFLNRRINEELIDVCRKISLTKFGTVLGRQVGVADQVTVGDRTIPWLKFAGFALLTAYALWLAVVGLKSRDRSIGMCMVFALGMIAPSYVLILLSYGDQNRYRAEVDPLYLIILAMLLERVVSGVTTLGGRPIRPRDPAPRRGITRRGIA